MNAALEVEWLKARRAPVYRWAALAVVAGVPVLTAAFFWLAGLGMDSVAGAKARAVVTDLSLTGYLGYSGQILTVALLLGGGITMSWTFQSKATQASRAASSCSMVGMVLSTGTTKDSTWNTCPSSRTRDLAAAVQTRPRR